MFLAVDRPSSALATAADKYRSSSNNDDDDVLKTDGRPWIAEPVRSQRSMHFYPRSNRNAWYRIATHQQFKPSGDEDTASGDHPMRWGR